MKYGLIAAAALFLASSSPQSWGQDLTHPPNRIMFGSCLNPRKPHPILSLIPGLGPDLFLFLGDNVYADTARPETMKRRYDELRRSSGFRGLRDACPLLAVWDDHDYGKNDAGAEFPMKEESREIFLDFWQVPGDAPQRMRDGIYHAHLLGPPGRRVQIILLDTRYFRTPLSRGRSGSVTRGPYVPVSGEVATLLGPEQWEWLEEQLRTPARLRIIASSIQVLAEHHGWESWANFPDEQSRLLAALKENGTEGVIFVSGDRHMAELSLLEQWDFYPLYDLTSSGLNVRFPSGKPSANRFRVGDAYLRENVGMISIDWEQPDPVVTLAVYDVEAELVLAEELKMSDLTIQDRDR
jgi:alkaline phosphatase D